MITPLIGVLFIFVIIVTGEILWRCKILKSEWSRKFVHIGVGTFVAFWPFFTSFRWVQLLALAFLGTILMSRWLHIFKGIHSVKRKTLGEVFYPIGIGLAALLTTNKYIFAAAILHLSLADGLAAIMGLKYGKRERYKVGKQTKSIIGTTTFCAVSAVIMIWLILSPLALAQSLWPVILAMPLVTALVEAVAPGGSDNLFIPLSVIGLLQLASLLT
jgi:phytol kinase